MKAGFMILNNRFPCPLFNCDLSMAYMIYSDENVAKNRQI